MHDHTYYLRIASQHFLSDDLPDNWSDLSIKEQDEFLSYYAWEPFQGMEPNTLMEHIEDLASALKRVAKQERIDTLSEVLNKLKSSHA